MIDDLRHFHASRGIKPAEYVWISILLALWGWAMVLPDVKPVPAPATFEVQRELGCDCPKQSGGKKPGADREWLRLQIAQQPDRSPCTVACAYGKAYLAAEAL